jgi:hypothetical protein
MLATKTAASMKTTTLQPRRANSSQRLLGGAGKDEDAWAPAVRAGERTADVGI